MDAPQSIFDLSSISNPVVIATFFPWKRRQEGFSGVEKHRWQKLLVAKKISLSKSVTNRNVTACHLGEHGRGVTTAVSP